MAKTLFGAVGAPASAHVQLEAALRRRITDLETEVLRLNAENDRLRAAMNDRDRLTADVLEPVGGH